MTATEARKNFFTMLQEIETPGVSIVITHEGYPKGVLMSVEDFEGWMETLEIMSDPELMKDIREAMDETETITLEELEESMHAMRNVQSPRQTKGAKTIQRAATKRSGQNTKRDSRSA